MVRRNALRKSMVRMIVSSMGRYLAILLIIGLGVGVFAGLRSSQPAMLVTGQAYLQENAFHDFQLMSTLGFTEEDVAAFAELDGVEAAEGAYNTDILMNGDREGEQYTLRIHSLTEQVDRTHLVAGRMPESPEECLADESAFTQEQLGSVLTVAEESAENAEDLTTTSFTIVGLVSSPRYLNYERGTTSVGTGTLNGFLYVLPEVFSSEAYHEVLLRCDLPGELYSETYEDAAEIMEDQVSELLDQRGLLRYTTLRNDAESELADARQELADGWQEYEDGKAEAEQELADAEQTLLDSQAELERGWQEYQDGKTETERLLEENRQVLLDGQQALESGRKQVEEQRQQLEEGLAKWQEGRDQLDNSLDQLGEQELLLVQQRQQLEEQKQAVLAPLEEEQRQILELQEALTQQLADAEAEGDEALASQLRIQLEQVQSQLEKVNAELQQAEEKFREPEEQLAAAEEQLLEQKNMLLEAEEQLAAEKETLDQGTAALDQAEQELTSREAELEQGWQSYESGKATAERELADARQELLDGEQELADGWEDYEQAKLDAEQELEDARQELTDGEAELADGEAELEDLKEPDLYTLDRDSNVGYVCFDNDTSIVAAVSVVFPVFFFLVAAFVCVTTMTRLVEENRGQIGTLKALGYHGGQIISNYMIYSGSAAVLGWLLGFWAGVLTIPRVIWSVYGVMYGFAPLKDSFSPELFLLCLAASLLCSCGAVLVACRAELKETAASLLRPKSVKAGKTIFLERVRPLWRHLSFLQKVSARNIFRYKFRLCMMLVGIGGCTALLVTGFGIRDSIQDIVRFQYEEIQLYDYSVTFAHAPEEATIEQTEDIDGVEEVLLVMQSAVTTTARDDSIKNVNILVSQTDSFQNFLDVHLGDTPVETPPAEGVVINSALAETLGVSVGDDITLRTSDQREITTTIAGLFDNYVYNYALMSGEEYQRLFGETPTYETLFVKSSEDCDLYGVAAALSGLDDVGSVTVNEDFAQRMNSTLSSLNYIVLLVVFCAGALAFIVLYNLTNINIAERTREIATLKVLGFYRGETALYIFREILILSAMGAVVGLPAGMLLHRFVMDQIQVDMVSFPLKILPLSMAGAFLLTMFFACLIAFFMRGKLDRIDMVESLKSVE